MIESIVWLVITSDWPPRCVSSSLSFSIGDWRAGRTGIAGIARASAGTDTVTTGNAASGGGSWADTGTDKPALARRTGPIGGLMQIGRTSCRERVWQYVMRSGGAVSLKKKKEEKKI